MNPMHTVFKAIVTVIIIMIFSAIVINKVSAAENPTENLGQKKALNQLNDMQRDSNRMQMISGFFIVMSLGMIAGQQR